MLPLFIIATLCLLAAGHDTDGKACQEIGKRNDCSCYKYFDGTYSVQCSFVRSLDHLKEIVTLAKGGKSMHFEFYKINVKEIPFDIFEGLDIEYLLFEQSQIKTFGDNKPFSGLENSLKTLWLYEALDKMHSDVATGTSNATVSHLNVLEELRLENEDLREVPDFWFADGPTSLQTLSLEGNKIATIGDNAFAKLEKLKQIRFFNNRIPTLKRSMFPKPANELSVLDLDLNRITELPTDIFSDMPKLTVVNFESNYLMTLEQTTWQGILQNNANIDVYLDGNLMHCDEKIKWIYEATLRKRLHGRCTLPHHLKGKNLRSLNLRDFESSGEKDD